MLFSLGTYGNAVLGGAFIGLAAALLLLFNGKIAGVSGIVNGLFFRPISDRGWRVAFLAGLIGTAFFLERLSPGTLAPGRFPHYKYLLLSGLLVGFGSVLGSGCTSGHGVCGVSRLSKRSLLATVVFMASGMGTVYVIRHVLGGL